MNGLQSSALVPIRLRKLLLGFGGVRCGRSVRIYPGCFFGSPNAEIGARSFVSVGCFLDGSDTIAIGPDVHLAPGAQLLTSTHAPGPATRRAGPVVTAPIRIEAGCWLGAGVMILPGCTIAQGCVIAAGSLVTKSTQADGLYVGRPATRVRDLDR